MEIELRNACGANLFQPNYEKVVELLRDKDINVNEPEVTGIFTSWTCLMISCFYNQKDIVRFLLMDKRVNVNEVTNDGRTAFYIACRWGKADVVKVLLGDPRIDINKSNLIRCTPIMIAYDSGYVEVLKLILGSRREINFQAKDNSGKNFFERAKENPYEIEGRSLIQSLEKNVNQVRNQIRRDIGENGTLFLFVIFFHKKNLKL